MRSERTKSYYFRTYYRLWNIAQSEGICSKEFKDDLKNFEKAIKSPKHIASYDLETFVFGAFAEKDRVFSSLSNSKNMSNFLFGVSIGTTDLDSFNTKGKVIGQPINNMAVFSPSPGIVWELGKAQAGFFYGWDFLNKANQSKYSWIYHRKPWISIGSAFPSLTWIAKQTITKRERRKQISERSSLDGSIAICSLYSVNGIPCCKYSKNWMTCRILIRTKVSDIPICILVMLISPFGVFDL